jgi:hypothetical protein
MLLAGALLGLGLGVAPAALVAQPSVPAENRSDLKTPPARPASEPLQEPGRRLFEAIVTDRPELAAGLFFPRDAFVLVKAMAKPERYYDKLRQRFDTDIHALHRSTRDLTRAEFVRLELTRRGGWVKPGDEGNRLPYWAARHALLHYRVGSEPRSLEVRVLISWGARWYVIHLSEFH